MGQVLVDDSPLDPKQVGAWRSRIGYVAQETFLFHDTVRGNLLWARPGASESDLHDALCMAAADSFVAALPHGLDTIVGERGVQLSGGERQRLALARALLRKPSLLILDEATSSIDVENERRIQDAIERLHGRLTILLITHRLGTVQGADSVNLLEHGRLLESGTWEELMEKTSGRFRTMFLTQNLHPVIPA
ncbi:MAG TPA: ABC transporter ATP-binding protein, partial [Chloroflexota bacterium]